MLLYNYIAVAIPIIFAFPKPNQFFLLNLYLHAVIT